MWAPGDPPPRKMWSSPFVSNNSAMTLISGAMMTALMKSGALLPFLTKK